MDIILLADCCSCISKCTPAQSHQSKHWLFFLPLVTQARKAKEIRVLQEQRSPVILSSGLLSLSDKNNM